MFISEVNSFCRKSDHCQWEEELVAEDEVVKAEAGEGGEEAGRGEERKGAIYV